MSVVPKRTGNKARQGRASVPDSFMQLIQVTQTHLDASVVGFIEHCPVALAIKEALRTSVIVGRQLITIGTVVYHITSELKNWMERYDKGEIVAPICVLLSGNNMAALVHVSTVNRQSQETVDF